MTMKELTQKLEERYPLEKAESWDNSGLQVGRKNKAVRKVFLALDATDAVIKEAAEWKADMLLTHHPLTLDGIRQVQAESLTGHKIFTLIRNDICHYAMHTNYDVVEMGEAAGEMMKLQHPEILEITGINEKNGMPEGIGRVGALVRPVTVEECAQIVKRIFGLDTVKIFGDMDQVIERVAICPGSGKSMIGTAIRKKAQVMITGDIGHHDGIDAVDRGIAVIDAGHYGLEHIFISRMEQYLKSQFPNLEIKKTESGNPFQVM
ncbi:Nif3-like dinuclear metal center hexameric protein [Lacrimispora saccharolytica]|nr:Nif3-like dinuclear metal center hexameric protein [Lacrimispora saccharolytica]